jgi:hypothetical protein
VTRQVETRTSPGPTIARDIQALVLVVGLVPLAPFAALPLRRAGVSVAIALIALFALGSWTGRISGAVCWPDGLRLLLDGRRREGYDTGNGATPRVD